MLEDKLHFMEKHQNDLKYKIDKPRNKEQNGTEDTPRNEYQGSSFYLLQKIGNLELEMSSLKYKLESVLKKVKNKTKETCAKLNEHDETLSEFYAKIEICSNTLTNQSTYFDKCFIDVTNKISSYNDKEEYREKCKNKQESFLEKEVISEIIKDEDYQLELYKCLERGSFPEDRSFKEEVEKSIEMLFKKPIEAKTQIEKS